jgi:hypothetical protein
MFVLLFLFISQTRFIPVLFTSKGKSFMFCKCMHMRVYLSSWLDFFFHPIIITHYSIYIFARCLSRLSHMMFSIKNTYCVCMIYCNSILWFINTAFVLDDFLKCFVYYIVDNIWMPVATHGYFASMTKMSSSHVKCYWT